MIRCQLLLLSLILSAPLLASDADQTLAQRLEAHIDFLADDAMAGRQTGEPGYRIAANYVASHFARWGLQAPPGMNDYFQPVPLRSAALTEDHEVRWQSGDEERSYTFLEEYFLGPNTAHTAVDLEAPMVFAGYGIDAPALGHNDYENLQVDGRIVVVLEGKPSHFPSEEGAHFSGRRMKRQAADERGAVALVFLHSPRRERLSAWSRLYDQVGMPYMAWLSEDGEPQPDYRHLQTTVKLHQDAVADWFAEAPVDLDTLLARDEAGEALDHFPLPGTLRIQQHSRHHELQSPNVVGMLRGSDDTLADEFILYTGHLDHVGLMADDRLPDRINNGALDNASGIAIMLETARLFSQGPPPPRSILFAAVTAEEKGLLGSEYLAKHPPMPAQQLVAVINIDMPVLLFDFADIIAFGAEHSTLAGPVRRAADQFDTRLSPDPFPDQVIFVRSDHYSFVKEGVPAVYLKPGMSSRQADEDARAIYQNFLDDHYHKVSDQTDLDINYQAAARLTRINHQVGQEIAETSERPRWQPDNFFGDTFGGERQTP